MRKLLSLCFLMVAFTLSATAQQKKNNIPIYTILKGKSIEWKTGTTEIKKIDIEGEVECVSLTFKGQGGTATIKGVKAGLVELTATLADGKTKRCKVRVNMLANAPDKTEAKWQGPYKLSVPRDNWHVEYTIKGQEVHKLCAAQIGNIYVLVSHRNEGPIYEKFDYTKQFGYQGTFSGNSFKYYYADGNPIEKENEEAAKAWFKEYAPPAGECFNYGPQDMVLFGHVSTDNDDFRGEIMQIMHQYNRNPSQLAKYYVGDETICGVKCWKFDFRKRPFYGSEGSCYWIDPSNGLCLKSLRESGNGFEVTIYNLNYNTWTSDMRPEGGN